MGASQSVTGRHGHLSFSFDPITTSSSGTKNRSRHPSTPFLVPELDFPHLRTRNYIFLALGASWQRVCVRVRVCVSVYMRVCVRVRLC